MYPSFEDRDEHDAVKRDAAADRRDMRRSERETASKPPQRDTGTNTPDDRERGVSDAPSGREKR